MKNNKKTLIKGIILLMLVAVIGTTYAYFAANITGNESTSTIVVTGGTMEIVYDNLSGTIEAYDIYPREDAWVTKNFTVTGNNSTNKDMKYKLALKVDKNTFSSGALTYSLTSTNTSNKGTIVASKTNQVISGSEVNFGTGIYPKGEDMVHTYTFELFFKDTGENQNIDQGKEFAGYIIIEENIIDNEIALSPSNLSSIGYTDGEVPASLVIPEKYKVGDEYNQVTSITNSAFSDNTTLTSLTLNEGLESIGTQAFYSATNLTGTLTIPSTVKSIGDGAFQNTGITGLILNENLESIGGVAFRNTTNLTGTLSIPSTVKTIGNLAFYGTGITGLTLNEGLESIGNNAFSNATNLTGTLTIPNTVKTIGNSAFSGTGITDLVLNERLESIGNSVFGNTVNLTSTVTIPSSVKTIGLDAFQSSGITGLILNEGLESIGVGTFRSTSNLTGHITFPSTVKTIGERAFASSGITGITLNEGLETIEIGVFINASSLTGTISIPSTVRTIKDRAFYGTGITGLILNDGLESIGLYAFQGASNLTGPITIPITVKSIGDRAFYATGVKTVNYPGSIAQWNQISIGTAAFSSGVKINYNYTGA